jgi:diguanylate cyclase
MEALRFVARIYRLRTLGLMSGCVAVAAVLSERHGSFAAWAMLVFTALIWPTLAFVLARRSPHPQRAEQRNLVVDSALGGFWVAVMQLDLVPSALFVAMMAADKVGVGGWRLLWRTLLAQAMVFVLTWGALGFPFAPHSSMRVVLLSLPFAFVYPIAISSAAYALARKVVRQNRLLDQYSRTDGLTGLSNRSNWEEMAQQEFLRARRTRRHSALLLLDVDDFKRINDRWGHAVGDAVLRRVAALMRQNVREVDTPGRFGGDEFGVVLVEVNPPDIRVPAERLRACIEAARFEEAPELRVTASVGAALFDPAFVDVEAWLHAADGALYDAKAAGRNCVVVRAHHARTEAASANAG